MNTLGTNTYYHQQRYLREDIASINQQKDAIKKKQRAIKSSWYLKTGLPDKIFWRKEGKVGQIFQKT